MDSVSIRVVNINIEDARVPYKTDAQGKTLTLRPCTLQLLHPAEDHALACRGCVRVLARSETNTACGIAD